MARDDEGAEESVSSPHSGSDQYSHAAPVELGKQRENSESDAPGEESLALDIDRAALLRHRRRLASALYTVYFHTEGGRPPRGSKLSSLDAANAVLASARSDGEQQLAQDLYWALGDARQSFKKQPKNRRGQRQAVEELQNPRTGALTTTIDAYLDREESRLHPDGLRGGRFFPYLLAESEASNDPATNETTARAVLLVNMGDLPNEQKFQHVARAVDPRAWIETGFFADIYRVDWDERGLPSYDENGVPLRNEQRDEQLALGELDRDDENRPGLPGFEFDDLVFENFDLQSIQGEPLSAFRNLLAIRCPEVVNPGDPQGPGYVLEFKLFRCLSSRLQGLNRTGGMDKNQGKITARTLGALAIVETEKRRALLEARAAAFRERKTALEKRTAAFEKRTAAFEKLTAALPKREALVEKRKTPLQQVAPQERKVAREESWLVRERGELTREDSWLGREADELGRALADGNRSQSALDVFIDRWVGDVGGAHGLAALLNASGGGPMREKLLALLKQLGLDQGLDRFEPSDPRFLQTVRDRVEPLIVVQADKTVHFTDLTPQGEPFIDIGELLNYAAPLLLKPFFEQLLILGVCARPKKGLRKLVRCRVKVEPDDVPE